MTKLLGLFTTLAFLAILSTANPVSVGGPAERTAVRINRAAASPSISPNVAQAKHNENTIIEARQYHNADYGSNEGPTGQPHPEQASTSARATSTSKAQMETMTAARRAVGKETEPQSQTQTQPQATHAEPVDYTQY